MSVKFNTFLESWQLLLLHVTPFFLNKFVCHSLSSYVSSLTGLVSNLDFCDRALHFECLNVCHFREKAEKDWEVWKVRRELRTRPKPVERTGSGQVCNCVRHVTEGKQQNTSKYVFRSGNEMSSCWKELLDTLSWMHTCIFIAHRLWPNKCVSFCF